MSRLPKILLNRTVVFVTSSVEEGLPFASNPLMATILEGTLARAQALHSVNIGHYVIEANHVHMILDVEDPDDVKGFMGRFKTESAHAVNKLLGKKKRTVWCKGYDSPTVLTVEDVIERIVYLYVNPVKDGLVESIDQYPGLSSWSAFRQKVYSKLCEWIRRSSIKKLISTTLTFGQLSRIAQSLKNQAKKKHELRIDPNAWMKCFGVVDPNEQERINNEIIRRIRERESAEKRRRVAEARSVIGRRKLILQPIDTPYVPDRCGRKMWCISSDIGLRKEFIRMAKQLVGTGRDVLRRWRQGDFSIPYPLGLFPPSMPKLGEPLGLFSLA